MWVATAVAEAAHREQLAEHGGGEGTRDAGALESAMARPRQRAAYEAPDAHDLAAAYAFGIARALAAGELSEPNLAQWFGDHAEPASSSPRA